MSSHSQSGDNAKSSSIAPSMAIVAHIGLPGQCQWATGGHWGHWAEGQQCWSNNEREKQQQQHINKETKNSKTERSNKYAEQREATQTGLVSAATLSSALFWDWIDKCNATTQYTEWGKGGRGEGERAEREMKLKLKLNKDCKLGFLLGQWHSITDWLCYVSSSFLPSFTFCSSFFFFFFFLWYLLAVTASACSPWGPGNKQCAAKVDNVKAENQPQGCQRNQAEEATGCRLNECECECECACECEGAVNTIRLLAWASWAQFDAH